MEEGVVIIGAGTAGLLTAKRLGLDGVDVVAYDQKHELGVPVRASGILSISGLERLGVNYSGCITNTLYGANIHAAGKVMKVVSKKPIAHILDRKKLNDRCHDEAVAAGARVVTRKRITGAELDGFSRNGIVVGADGAVSTVAKHFGFGAAERMVLTYKAEFDADLPDDGIVQLFFDNRKYRGLFAWLAQNSKGLLEAGVGVEPGSGNARMAFDEFVASKEAKAFIGSAKKVTEGASVIPMVMRKRFVDEEKRIMLVGDAAGHIKPTTGGGIIFGGNGAIMAAETILRYRKGEAELSEYESSFRKRYGFDMMLHSFMNKVYCSSSPEKMGMIISALNFMRVDKFLGKYGDMDMPSLILKRFFFRSLAR